VTRPVASASTRPATARVSRVTEGAHRAWVRAGVYFAPVGQTGMQLALPAQGGPYSGVASLLRPCGVPTTRSPVGPAPAGSVTSRPSSRAASTRSRWLAGTGAIGKA
jgi:hypothetical protein